jgi:hypothetical protein
VSSLARMSTESYTRDVPYPPAALVADHIRLAAATAGLLREYDAREAHEVPSGDDLADRSDTHLQMWLRHLGLWERRDD